MGHSYRLDGTSGTSNHDQTPVDRAETDDGSPYIVWIDEHHKVHADTADEARQYRKEEEKPIAGSPLAEWKAFATKYWNKFYSVKDAVKFLGTPMEGPAALMAFGTDSFQDINLKPSHPVSKALLIYIERLPITRFTKIYRALGFFDAGSQAKFIKTLGKTSTQKRTLSSWTADDPTAVGQTPMNNIALDLAQAQGDYLVVLICEGKTKGKDISFLYSKTGMVSLGTEIVLPKGSRFKVKGIVHPPENDKHLYVVVSQI
jgi:hypothetical protein